MTRPLIILGTGGSARDVLDTVEAINGRGAAWRLAGFLDDARPAGSSYLGLPVLGRLTDAPRWDGHWFVNAIGSDKSYRLRPNLVAATGVPAERFATLVHPFAGLSSRAKLGRGVCVHFGVSVGGGARIGDHVTLCPSVTVGHDAVVEDFAVVAPAAVLSGFVRLGECCYIGTRAAVRQMVTIGSGALVGMGSVVLNDVPARVTVAGNPARELRRRGEVAPPSPAHAGISAE